MCGTKIEVYNEKTDNKENFLDCVKNGVDKNRKLKADAGNSGTEFNVYNPNEIVVLMTLKPSTGSGCMAGQKKMETKWITGSGTGKDAIPGNSVAKWVSEECRSPDKFDAQKLSGLKSAHKDGVFFFIGHGFVPDTPDLILLDPEDVKNELRLV